MTKNSFVAEVTFKSGGQAEVIIILCNPLVVSVVERQKCRNSLTVKMSKEKQTGNKEKVLLTFSPSYIHHYNISYR